MARVAIVYETSTGITRQFAEEIGDYLGGLGLEVSVESIDDADPAVVATADRVLLGCWTNGIFIAFQHPTDRWVAWARKLPAIAPDRLGLFTTYKLATGRMFGQMRSKLPVASRTTTFELKSRDGHLSEAHRRALKAFVGAEGSGAAEGSVAGK